MILSAVGKKTQSISVTLFTGHSELQLFVCLSKYQKYQNLYFRLEATNLSQRTNLLYGERGRKTGVLV